MSETDASLQQALESIFARTAAGIKPGLDAITALLELLDHPERRFLVVHLAGTNGKGSVGALLESILRAAGIKTGFFSSPHLVRINERFRVNGQVIDDDALAPLLRTIDEADIQMVEQGGSRPCTFFELSTAMAFQHFAEQDVQIAVIETGVGGVWDSTNVVEPLVSVITRIGMDHMEYLGDTLEAIAAEKCGIIKPGRPVVATRQAEPSVDRVITEAANKAGSPYFRFSDDASITPKSMSLDGQKFLLETPFADYGTCTISLLGHHQLENAAVAVTAAEVVFDQLGLDLPEAAIKEGLAATSWAGRCMVIDQEPPLIVDGAHNPSGAASLVITLQSLFPGQQGYFILGFLEGKQVEGMLKLIAPLAAQAWGVPVQSPRGLPLETMQTLLQSANIPHEMCELEQALTMARERASAEGRFVCVAGSLYLAGTCLEMTGTPI